MGMRIGGSSRRSRDTGFQWLIIGIILGMGCTFTLMLSLYVFEIIEVTPLEDTTDDNTAAAEVVVVTAPPPQGTTSNLDANPAPTGGDDVAQETMVDDPTAPDENAPLGDTPANDMVGADDANLSPTSLPGADTSAPESGNGTGVGGTGTTTAATPVPAGPTPTATIGFAPSGQGGGSADSAAPDTREGAEIEVTQPAPGGNSPQSTGPGVQSLLAIATPLREVPGGVFKMGTTEEEGRTAVANCISIDGGTCDYDTMVVDSVPPHDVRVDTFQMEQYEVNVLQYVAFLNYLLAQNPDAPVPPHLIACNSNVCALTTSDPDGTNSDIAFDGEQYLVRPDAFDRSNFPMTFVSWNGAQAYCEALGRRLPSEAEWERAARGTDNSTWPWGFQWAPRDNRANTSRTGVGTGPNEALGTWEVQTVPQGNTTEDGIANLAGNVAEWTADYFNPTLYQQRASAGTIFENPRETANTGEIVVRGGTWDYIPMFSRTVHRLSRDPNFFLPNVGFRCVE
jgi:formylglycine-generating enzyme required for sulfatase activity